MTAVVDVTSGQILDVFEGHDAADLWEWLAGMPQSWRDSVRVVSVDPHEGYRSALANTTLLGDVTMVVDPFNIVRLANMAVTRCRQRVQQATVGHRAWTGDPLYNMRKLFLLGAERVDDQGWDRIWAAFRDGDPDGEVQDCWVAKEKVRDVYLTDDPSLAAVALDDAIAWCTAAESGPELRRLAKTLRRWRTEILAHHVTGASNGPVEAANLMIKQVARPDAGSATLSTIGSESCSPVASRANVNPSRDSEHVPAQSRRAIKRCHDRRRHPATGREPEDGVGIATMRRAMALLIVCGFALAGGAGCSSFSKSVTISPACHSALNTRPRPPSLVHPSAEANKRFGLATRGWELATVHACQSKSEWLAGAKSVQEASSEGLAGELAIICHQTRLWGYESEPACK